MSLDTDGIADEFDKLSISVLKRINEMAMELREHCDSVVIIATVSEGDSSQMIHSSRGNKSAIDGSVDRFARRSLNEERVRDEKRFSIGEDS